MPIERLEPAQQVEDLRLDGDVEGGGGLVGDQQVGLVGEGHGDHHALALPARELMRIGARGVAPLPTVPPGAAARGCAHGPPPGAGACARGAPRSPASRSCVADSARSWAPGRSWRSGCRGRRAAPSPWRRAVRGRETGCCRWDDGPPDRAGAGGSTARSPTCRSRSRPPGARVSPRSRSKRDLAHGGQLARRRGEGDRQIAHAAGAAPRARLTPPSFADRRRRARPRPRRRAGSASRRGSGSR